MVQVGSKGRFEKLEKVLVWKIEKGMRWIEAFILACGRARKNPPERFIAHFLPQSLGMVDQALMRLTVALLAD